MSAIMGRYTKTGYMPSGAEICLECADDFDRRSGSRGRREVTLLWIYKIFTCTMQGAERCWTRDALEDEDLIWRYQLYRPYSPAGEG